MYIEILRKSRVANPKKKKYNRPAPVIGFNLAACLVYKYFLKFTLLKINYYISFVVTSI